MKHKFKRGLSLILSCALVLTLLPATALAAGGHQGGSSNDDWYKSADTSTVIFKIVNGTWKADQNFGGTVNDDRTEVSFTVYKYSDQIGYVYECSDQSKTTTMETILNAILGYNAATYITPDTGYEVTSQDWAVEKGGITGSSANANAQMQAIKNNIHNYDTHGTPTGGFQENTVYVLTLTKQSYSVTASIDNNGSVSGKKDSYSYQAPVSLTFTPAEGYEIDSVTVNDIEVTFTLNDDGSYTYSNPGITTDITVAVTTKAAAAPVYVYAQVVDENGNALGNEAITNLNDQLGNQLVTHSTYDGQLWLTLGKIPNFSGLGPADQATEGENVLSEYNTNTLSAQLEKIERYSANQNVALNLVKWVSLHGNVSGATDYAETTGDNGNTPTWHLDGQISVTDIINLSVTKTVTSISDAEGTAKDSAEVGDIITWTITVFNSGCFDALISAPTDTLTIGEGENAKSEILTLTSSASVEDGKYTVPAAKIDNETGNSTPGSITFTATYTVTSDDAGKTLTNVATVPGSAPGTAPVPVKGKYDYTIEYYYDGAIDNSKTVTGTAAYGTELTYTDKVIDGYKLEKTDPTTLTITEKDNVLRVYYVKDSFAYTVEYYFDDVKGDAPAGEPTGGTAEYGTTVPVEPSTPVTVGEDNYVLVSENHSVTITSNESQNVIQVYYEKDNWDAKNDKETGGDGTPDSQQALIKYVAETGGSVSPTVQVETLDANSDGDYVGTANVSSTAKADDNYAFDYWVDPNNSKSYDPKLNATLTVEGGKTYTYTAHFDTDVKGDPNAPENGGDDIPDKYQVKVTFEVENGAWDNKTTADVVKYVTLTETVTDEDGKESKQRSETGSYTLTEADGVPTAGNEPNEGYGSLGSWSTLSVDNTNKTPVGEVITAKVTYTYTYPKGTPIITAKVPYKVNHHVWNTETEEYDLKDTDTVMGEVGKKVTATAKQYEGYTLNTQTSVTTGTVIKPVVDTTNVTNPDNAKITMLVLNLYYDVDVVGDTDDNGDDIGDEIPDKYQVKVTFEVENGAWNDGTKTDVVKYVTLTDNDGNWSETGSYTLTADDVPAVGNEPDDGYKVGKWDVNPESNTVTAESTYTYAYTNQTVILTVTKIADQKTAEVGDTITWTIKVTNNGEVDLSDLTLDDTMSGVTVYDENGDPISSTDTFALAVGDTATFTAEYKVRASDEGSSLSNTVIVTVPGDPDDPDDDQKFEDTSGPVKVDEEEEEPYESLLVRKSVDNKTPEVGDTIEYTIKVTNTGDTTLRKVTVKDVLKNAAGSISVDEDDLPDGVTYNKRQGSFTIDTLHTGRSVTITYTYEVLRADAGKTLTNTVSAASSGDAFDREEETVKVKKDSTPSVTPTTPVETDKPTLNIEDHVAYIIGYTDGTVRPENNITRAEVATIFFRLLTDESRARYWSQTNEYSDVNSGDWFNNAISTLSNAGIITGYPNGAFQPNAPITRAEFSTIAARFSDVVYSGSSSFIDVSASHWAARYIALAEYLGWITGYPDGTFKPDQNITRAEAMTLINRVLERAVEEQHMLPDMVAWIDNLPDAWYYEAVQEATNSHEYFRLFTLVPGQDFRYEHWQEILNVPDWAALEKAWSTVNGK